MANPAIIIGLGGTGQWVLTYIKKNLEDTYGQVPQEIRLLSFDTTSEKTEAKVERNEEHAKVGNIQLSEGEFVYLGGDIRKICKKVADGEGYNQLSSWLQAKYYLSALDDDAFLLSKGAGQRRQFGRMAVFYDLGKNPSEIYGKIEQAITDVSKSSKQQIEIFITCSLAGGTGSGMVIDIAHIVRQIAENKAKKFAIRAFLVLQNTFQSVLNVNDIHANSFAAIREISRFLQVFDRDYPIYYTDDKSSREPTYLYHSVYKNKLFDTCFLLDARRERNTLEGAKPWLGMFPAVAECMTALLDNATGDTFSQHYKNVNTRLGAAQIKLDQALFSSLGTYTYILPVEDMIETAVHRASLELLKDRLFKIDTNSRSKQLEVTFDNQAELSFTPKEVVGTFFSSDKTANGTDNILYFQQMQTVLDNPSFTDQIFIEEMATRGLELLSWLTPVEQDDEVNLVAQSIQSVIEASVLGKVSTSEVKGDEPHSAANRIIADIKEFKDEKLGYEDKDSRHIPGTLQKGLAKYAMLNRRRFRQILVTFLATILNGETSDPVVAKSGKLPYATEVVHWMIKSFDDFEGFIKNIMAYRAKTGEMAAARDDAIRTRQIMVETKNLSDLINRLKKTAIHGQEDYIAAEDYLFQLEREEILYKVMLDYSIMFKKIAIDAKSQLDIWTQILTLGGELESTGTKEPGAYNLLVEQKKEIKRRRKELEDIMVYKYLTDDNHENKLYERLMNDDKWAEFMRRLDWKINLKHDVKKDNNQLNEIKRDVRYWFDWEEKEENDFLIDLTYYNEKLSKKAEYEESPSLLNARFLVNKLRPYFFDIRNETIADRLQEMERAEGLAKQMLDKTAALISYDPPTQTELEKHNFICINKGGQVSYFNDVASGLKKSAPTDQTNQVIGLTNHHRCIVLSTLDLLIGYKTEAVETSKNAYMQPENDHKLMHNFPAEVNASVLEGRLTRPPINESRRLLAPRLVALLEDPEMIRRYVLSRVYGLIREVPSIDDPNKSQMTLILDRENRRDLSYRINLTLPNTYEPEELDAITQFILVEIDREQGLRYIRDINPGITNRVEPKRVDDTIELFQRTILSGRDILVKEFEKILKESTTLLNSRKVDSHNVLSNAFRRFVHRDYDRYDRETRLGKTENLNSYIKEFLDRNRDCLAVNPENLDQEAAIFTRLTDDIVTMLENMVPNVCPVTYSALTRKIDDYIESRILPMREKTNDQLTRDLGSIMHLILWDEVERLERLSDNQSYT